MKATRKRRSPSDMHYVHFRLYKRHMAIALAVGAALGLLVGVLTGLLAGGRP